MPDSPKPGPPGPSPARPATVVERPETVMETDDDLRAALLAARQGQAAPSAPAQPAARPASPFRPTVRPPSPVLTVFDDGEAEGEVIRVRDPHFVIGRTEGSLRFPLDGRMSSRHVEITLQGVGGAHRWVVTDLRSTHGMFVRVRRTALADKAEILVGNGRYRFEAARASDEPAEAGGAETGQTQGWAGGSGPIRPAALTELIGDEIGNRALLVRPEYWIGSDPACPIARPDDPFCEARHVRLSRDPKGAWHAEHNKTRNGLWIRMTQIALESMVQFQAGEQRFRLTIR